MTERVCEYVRELLSKARAKGVQNRELQRGNFISGAESISDAVSILDDRGYSVSERELLLFVKDFVSANTFSVVDILGLPINPIEPVPEPNDQSCWLAYKSMLQTKAGFSSESIVETERYARWVVDNLDVGQGKGRPRRGLVMGSVQSGKTANMGAVMSMAADRGVNVFIVYAGVMNSLRDQTMSRFAEDLKDSLTSHWHVHDFNEKGKDFSDVHCETGASARNLIVVLKNATRLSRLGAALEKAASYKKSMRILIIDDEADQASPDSEEMSMTEEQELAERSKINKCLVKILFNKCTKNSKESSFPFGSINYLCYTATPYANVLNEAGKESLYPGDFMVSLPEPSNYFGIKAMFGDGDAHPHGLNIIRTIPDAEAEDAGSGDFSLDSGTALGRALAWFVCSAAVMRQKGYCKPISMLINPSARVKVHGDLDDVVWRWLKNIKDSEFVGLCQTVYDKEKSAFTKTDLINDFPGKYGNIDSVEPLPSFDSIAQEVKLLKSKIDRIKAEEGGTLSYHEGIHICVDNSASRGKSDAFFRIVYPKKDVLEHLPKAPVFIVIGGSTLSRGLTLEGLCCSYFTRNVHQADTLMQMGRWFGYRGGYELLQRVWMTYDTERQFRAMARMDIALKAELDRYRLDKTLRPDDYGPRVLQLPDAVHLRLTAANRMQHATVSSYDFSGAGYETTEFSDSKEVVTKNNNKVSLFLSALPAPVHTNRGSGGYVWRGVSSSGILGLLSEYDSPEGMTFNQYMKDFIPWMKSLNNAGQCLKWNVALCGPDDGLLWPATAKIKVGCIGRTQYVDATPGIIDIGSLRSGIDAIIDAEPANMSIEQKNLLVKLDDKRKNVISGRKSIGMGDVPLLLVYVVDGKGNTKTKRVGRKAINIGTHIVGLAVIVSGDQRCKNHGESVSVRTKW